MTRMSHVKISGDTYNAIMEVLGEIPAKFSARLMLRLDAEIAPQVKAAQETEALEFPPILSPADQSDAKEKAERDTPKPVAKSPRRK